MNLQPTPRSARRYFTLRFLVNTHLIITSVEERRAASSPSSLSGTAASLFVRIEPNVQGCCSNACRPPPHIEEETSPAGTCTNDYDDPCLTKCIGAVSQPYKMTWTLKAVHVHTWSHFVASATSDSLSIK